MAARTALITGVLGQDGSLLAELLLSRGYQVVGVARPGARLPIDGPLAAVQFADVDLTDAKAVRALLQRSRPDELYHLAAIHHASQDETVDSEPAARAAMLSVNFASTQVLALALLEVRAACHLIYASSSQMFTPTRMDHEIDEASARNPGTFYGHVKSWSTDLLGHLREHCGLRASVAILFNHESPRRGAQFVSRKITRAAAQAARGHQPRLRLQNIGARVDWSSADDVAVALALMGRADIAGNYVIASGTLRSVRELLSVAFAGSGLEWARFTDFESDAQEPALLGNSNAARKRLGWSPQNSFETTIREMVAHDMRAASVDNAPLSANRPKSSST